MNRTQSLTAVGILALGISLVACGGAEQQPATETSQQQAPAQTQSPAATTEAQTYPIDWCIVSGEKLGSMGDPVVYNYQGKTIKFCCKRCVEIFEKAPEGFMAKYDSAAAGLLTPPGEHEGHSH